jgi:hypothetical protein
MPHRWKFACVLLALLCVAVFTSNVPGIAKVAAENLKGSIQGNLYTSPEKDFQVVIPVSESNGGKARDASTTRGDTTITQVIFTDDFGDFFRILSFKTPVSIDDIHVFHDVREEKIITTKWGRTRHLIDVEKEGSELTVTSIEKGGTTQTVTPDMITANALFATNGHIYHLVAGFPILKGRKLAEVQDIVNTSLDELMTNFKPLETEKTNK